MTDYNDIITRLRSMDGIGDIQLNELMNRETPMVAADAIAELVARVAYLESRLEVGAGSVARQVHGEKAGRYRLAS